jgi:hypothetical protein
MDCCFQRARGRRLHGDGRLISHERNDLDVSADERIPFSALDETDRQPNERMET